MAEDNKREKKNILKLIEEMCPDGVEWKRLGDVTVMKRGTSLTKKTAEEGDIPVISGGRQPAFYCNQSNRDGKTITVAGSGAGAGFVQYWNEPIFACDCFTVKGTETLDTRYVYYCMTSMQDAIYDCKKGGGVPHVHISDIEGFEIPIPPLAVQREVVRVLDTFTELTAELTVELTARRKQYEYYRDEMLRLDGVEDVEWKRLGDIAEVGTGSSNGKDAQEDGEYPFFIRSKTVKRKNDYEYDEEAIIIPGEGGIGDIYHYVNGKYALHQRVYRIHFTTEGVDTKFAYYYFSSAFKDFIDHKAVSGTVKSIRKPMIEDFTIPIPPLSIQRDIVHKLDAFSSYCNDLTSVLPAEIEARKKQYTYYRDRLLSFPPVQ